jgi:hypothetical protein
MHMITKAVAVTAVKIRFGMIDVISWFQKVKEEYEREQGADAIVNSKLIHLISKSDPPMIF